MGQSNRNVATKQLVAVHSDDALSNSPSLVEKIAPSLPALPARRGVRLGSIVVENVGSPTASAVPKAAGATALLKCSTKMLFGRMLTRHGIIGRSLSSGEMEKRQVSPRCQPTEQGCFT